MKILRKNPQSIPQLIKSGKVTVGIIGLGYVGLPLAILFANKGAKVIGNDIREDIVNQIRDGKSPIEEYDVKQYKGRDGRILKQICPNCAVQLIKASTSIFCPHCMREVEIRNHHVRLLSRHHTARPNHQTEGSIQTLLQNAVKKGRLLATTDTISTAKQSEVILITVGTPIDQSKKPDTTALQLACAEIGKGLTENGLVILKSTVSPGTTENLVAPIITKNSGLVAGKDYGLAHMPERALEGLALYEFQNTPRIVAGIDRRSTLAAAAVFKIFPAPIFIYDNPKITEAAKLFENIYRDTNIALSNELALACEALGIDVMKVIEAAHTDPKTHLLTPGAGVGGYCLPKDTYYLIEAASKRGFTPKLITQAREINDKMPSHMLQLVKEAYDELHIPVKGSAIAVLGLAFKGNSGDTRNSPTLTFVDELNKLQPNIIVQDPLADHLARNPFNFTPDLQKAVSSAESIVLMTDHTQYRTISPKWLRKYAPNLKAIIDGRHVFDPNKVKEAGFVYKGLGRQ